MANAPIKVDSRTDQLITQAAHFLGTSKKDVVDEAVREYVENHRAQIQRGVREALEQLDGTTASSVRLLADLTPGELDEIGGVDEPK
ncbi:type II toxin-antitoxin system VapB family antitoxin [Kribbella sp. CA-247076]|uniref:type II toxin-antitoxin system VapB family antitoxin n=1 Tax=Kribbella sp. CA-247076 TaxID=3239941 RepID=UPI003D8CE16F